MKKLLFIIFILNITILYSQEVDFKTIDFMNQIDNYIVTLESRWEELNKIYSEQDARNASMEQELNSLQKTINELRMSLDAAMERVSDAEGGAISLLDENTELYNLNKSLQQDTINMEAKIRQQAQQLRNQPFVFFGGSVLSAGGGGMLAYGLAKDNTSMTIAGGATLLGTGAIYLIGHLVFQWW